MKMWNGLWNFQVDERLDKQFAVGAVNIQGFESKMGLNELPRSNQKSLEAYAPYKSWNRYFNLFDHAQLNKA